MPMPTQNIMLTVAYDGTNYCGWQVQPNGRTVQQCVESSITRLTGETVRILCAGRTDSGVHALGQVASFRTESKIPAKQFRRGLQRYLPEDITIIKSVRVSDEFHATFSARRKRYRYLIWDGPVLPPGLRHHVYQTRRAIKIEPMVASLKALRGTHDFRCFETNYPNKKTSERTIMDATIERCPAPVFWTGVDFWPTDARPHEAPQSPLISFEVEADGFLYNMVRAIVGTLLRIGNGQRSVEYLGEVIMSQNRSMAGTTAPAHGLYLVEVDYPSELLTVPDKTP